MRVTLIIMLGLALFSCKKEKVFDSDTDGEAMKLLHADITSWEGKDAPLCESGHPDCGADYYFDFLIPKNTIELKKMYVNNVNFYPEKHIVPGTVKDTLKIQMHFFEHASCSTQHPEFILKDIQSQEIRIDYMILGDERRSFVRRVPVVHKSLD